MNRKTAIARDLPEVAPAYFVVDIQTDQLAGFRDMLAANTGVRDVESAPMLRGIISRINGQPATEMAGDHWVLSGDRGITYSAEPADGTVITEGEWWAPDYTGPPLVSFAAEEGAETLRATRPRLRVGLVHGRMKSEEKELVMRSFAAADV